MLIQFCGYQLLGILEVVDGIEFKEEGSVPLCTARGDNLPPAHFQCEGGAVGHYRRIVAFGHTVSATL